MGASVVALALMFTFARFADSQVAPTETPATAPAAAAPAAGAPAVAPPTTAPAAADAGDELLQPKADMPGNGAEVYRIVNEKDEIVSVLHNGATIICKRVPSPAASVRGYVYTGGVYEGKWLGGGLSHLLEHLVAGGSSERRTEAENRNLLQKIGNDSNAYTTYDHTAFFINTTTPHFDDAVDLVTGWMLGAKITEPEYRREYQVVQRELERNKGNPDMVFWQLMEDNRYKVSPARIPVIGYQEVIQGLSRDDVYSYYKMAYQPNNMVFAVAANIDPEIMLATVRKNVADALPGRVFSRDIAQEPPVTAPRTVVATFPKLGQARMDLSFPSVKQTSDDMYALDLLAQILGGGESAIFDEQIRDQQQLCSAISASDDTPAYVDGSFEIDVQLDPDKIAPATKAILAEIDKIKTGGVDADRLTRAKAEMKIARLKGMQTSEDVAASLATDYMATGDPHFSDRYVTRIAALTNEDLQAVAKKYFDTSKLITTVLLPREAVGNNGLPKAEDLIRGNEPATTQKSTDVVAALPTITRTVLSNGLIVLHKQITTTPLVQINMYALGGLTLEDASNNGIGNLTMSLLRRGTTTKSADQLSDFFDLTGGDLATDCGRNTWYWNVSSTKDDFAKTMEVYADVVNNPAFAPDQLSAIKTRVGAAIEGEDATWDGQAFRYFYKQFYGAVNSPYQFDVLGNSDHLAKFTVDDVKNWYTQKILTAPRVLAIFGDVDNATAVAMAQKYFGGGPMLPSTTRPASTQMAAAQLASTQSANTQPVAQDPPAGLPDKPSVNVVSVSVQKTDLDVAGVVVGFRSNSIIGAPNQGALTVSQCLTGGFSYPTGYIFETLRGKGLVYEAATFNSAGRSKDFPGGFIAYAGCDPKNVNAVVDEILLNIARLQGTPADIQTDWFTRCKDLITTEDALENETPSAQASQASLDELMGLGYDYHSKFPDSINNVTLDDVHNVAAGLLRDCVITISTPAPERVTTKAGARTYDSFPPVDLTPRGIQHDVGGK